MKPLPFLSAASSGRLPTPAQRDPGRPAIIVPVQQTDPSSLPAACADIAASGIVDVIEWRIDPLVVALGQAAEATDAGPARVDADAVAEAVRALAPHVTSAGPPVLVTLRSGFEGGEADISEADYAEVVRRLGALGTAAVDVEIARSGAPDLIDAVHAQGVAVVASQHNFTATDSVPEMRTTLAAMREAGADVAKIAMMPQSPADVADLLRATAESDARLDCPVIGISMGRLGRTSRILGGDFGSCATFAQMGQPSAPGQIDAAELAAMLDALCA
ncbi:type I 3-dehydroquinate dehydratase [Brevibacterium casei]|uniref:type I 3-dehydroquinate dehydratase n=1 Tax=Brevibacterium casei TaxID=33889 RepID=UPI003700381F